jgi:hypothetical protein
MQRLKREIRRWPALYRPAAGVYALGWEMSHRVGLGNVPPPHVYKARLVKRYRSRYRLLTLVETGTFHGHMLEAVQDSFSLVYSIELDDALYEAACRRFQDHRHIHLLHGDSGHLIKEVLSQLRGPALFWLDAHWSGEGTAGEGVNPVERELMAILECSEKRHVVLIDDARLFMGKGGYPTLKHLQGLVRASRPEMRMSVEADVIRIEKGVTSAEGVYERPDGR